MSAADNNKGTAFSQSAEAASDFILHGLSSSEAAARPKNTKSSKKTNSTGRIIAHHVCTLFNFVNFVLAAALFAVGSYKNTLFIIIVLCNLFIGVFQELRSKRALDKLSVINRSTVCVIRDSVPEDIPAEDIVMGDLLVLSYGCQVPADCTVLSGSLEVDEACITGESDGIAKHPGDTLYAGSVVLSGQAKASADAVGADCYMEKLAHSGSHRRPDSQIMSTLRRIIFVLSLCVIPVCAIMFFVQRSVQGGDLAGTVTATAAAVLGMIPDGLVLLTSTVLAIGVVRLSRRKVLVQELYCIENLARVDTLCLDKTGTLTQGTMTVEQVIPLSQEAQNTDIPALCAALTRALCDNNATFDALRRYFADADTSITAAPSQVRPFNSRLKWSGARLNNITLVWGAPEFVLPDMPAALSERLHELALYSRVLLLAKSSLPFPEDGLPEGLIPLCAITLRDDVRPDAAQTLAYFHSQDVDIRVFSGDSAPTVERIAAQCGIPGAAFDCTGRDPQQLYAAAAEYRLFARVTPLQKQLLVEQLRSQGHTVAFVGDGVNDVPALRTADCSVAMGNGTAAARGISQLVLLNNDFASMPAVVAEGRRCINNLQRSASLFLIKTLYASLLAVLFVLIGRPYPFQPIQMSLLSCTGIGIPSFVLALEPNRERVRGNFLKNILCRCIPGGISVFAGISLLYLSQLLPALRVADNVLSTACMIVTGFAFMVNLFYVSMPLNRLRGALCIGMCLLLAGGMLLFPGFFALTALPFPFFWAVPITAACELAVFTLLRLLLKKSVSRTA